MTKQTYTFEELREAAAKAGIEVKPPPAPKQQGSQKPDPGVSELRKAIKKKARTTKTEGSAPAVSTSLRRRVHYVKEGGEQEFVKGSWIECNAKFWQSQSRLAAPNRVLEVLIPDGPTITEAGLARRGCLVCGRS